MSKIFRDWYERHLGTIWRGMTEKGYPFHDGLYRAMAYHCCTEMCDDCAEVAAAVREIEERAMACEDCGAEGYLVDTSAGEVVKHGEVLCQVPGERWLIQHDGRPLCDDCGGWH